MKKRYQFMIIFLVISLIISILFSYYSFNLKKEEIELKIEKEINDTLNLKTKAINEFLKNQLNKFYSTYNNQLFSKLFKTEKGSEEYNRLLNLSIKKLKESEMHIAIAPLDGVIVAANTPQQIGVNVSLSPAFAAALKGKRDYAIYPKKVFPSKINMGIGEKIYDEETGKIVGAYGGGIELDKLHKITLSNSKEYIETYIVEEERLLLLTPSKYLKKGNRGVLTQIINTPISYSCFNMTNKEGYTQKKIIRGLDYGGEKVIGSYKYLKEPGWCVIVEINTKNVLDKPLKKNIINKTILSLIFICILTIIGFFIGKFLEKGGKNEK